jgi:flagellar protein FliJ
MPGKSFQFSLDSVLRIRKHETETARRQLQRVAAMRAAAEDVVAEAERVLTEHVRRPLEYSGGPAAFLRHASYRDEARVRLESARRRVSELERAEEEARARLVERRREEESLQQLHDEERLVHITSHESAEAACLDEQALSGFNRQRQPRQ